MTTRYYRKAWDIAGWTYHADCYCADCGDTLPDIDPEGNDRHPVFVSDMTDILYWSCATCGLPSEDW